MTRSGKRKSKRGRAKARQRRRVAAGTLLACLVVLGWAAWNGVRAAQELSVAAEQLRSVRTTVSAGGPVVPALQSAADRTISARRHLNDPVVRTLAAVPGVGRPIDRVTSLAFAADIVISQSLLPFATAAGDNPAARLVSRPGTVDIAFLEGLLPAAESAAQSLEGARTIMDAAPMNTWIGPLDTVLRTFDNDLTDLTDSVDNLVLALDVAPDLLAKGGTRRYLVLSQSPAEARGTGGLLGGYSLLEVSNGSLEIVRSGPRAELKSAGEPVLDLGAEFNDHYGGNGPTLGWINSNLSPHYPYAARIWMELWKRQYGEQLDGAVLLDPVALSYLLSATGPVPLTDGTVVTPQNVVDLTLRDVYARFADNTRQDAFLQQISTGVATALTDRPVGGAALAAGLSRAVQERRLLLWSTDTEVQEKLADEAISGSLPEGRPAVGDVIVDAGSKLDYYLERDLRYTAGCGRDPSMLALTLTNSAPATGLPDAVTPARFRDGLPAGTNKLLLTLYLPPSAVLERLAVNDEPTAFAQGTELGLEWISIDVTLLPGEAKTVAASFRETAPSDGQVERVKQPLVRPESFSSVGC